MYMTNDQYNELKDLINQTKINVALNDQAIRQIPDMIQAQIVRVHLFYAGLIISACGAGLWASIKFFVPRIVMTTIQRGNL